VISGKITSCEISCVVFYPDFDTFADFLDFTQELFSNKVTEYFRPVQEAFRKHLSNPDLVLDAVMNAEQLANCMNYIGKCFLRYTFLLDYYTNWHILIKQIKKQKPKQSTKSHSENTKISTMFAFNTYSK